MAKRLRTTAALAVVVMMLVGACSSSSTPSPAASRRASAPAAPSAAASAAASASAAPARGRVALAPAVPTVPTGYTELDKALGADGKAVQGQDRFDPDPVDRRRRHELRGLGRRLREGDRHQDPDRQHRLEPRDRAEDAHRGRQAAGPGDARPADARPGLRRRRARSSTWRRSWMPTKLSTEHPATIGLVTQGGKIWGVPYKADVKSTIWYPIKAFAAKGYTVPTTWDELIALSDKIVADGSNPWCISAGGPGDRDRLAAHRLGRGSGPQDQGPRLLQRLDQPQGHVRGPGHQGRLRQVRRQDLLHARTTSSAATRRSSPPTRRRRWTRCSPTIWPTRSAGCRRSRPGTARTSSRISAPADSRRSTSSALTSASSRSRPSTRPRRTSRARPTRS